VLVHDLLGFRSLDRTCLDGCHISCCTQHARFPWAHSMDCDSQVDFLEIRIIVIRLDWEAYILRGPWPAGHDKT